MQLRGLTKNNVFLLMFVGVVAFALALGNPASTEWPLKCPLYWLTGLKCPLCGMQRMVHELLHLRIASAWAYNAVLLATLPYWAVLLAGQVWSHWQETNSLVRFCYRNPVLALMLGIMVAWGVARNL